MKKTIKLTESDLNRMVKKIVVESTGEEEKLVNDSIDFLTGYFGYDPEELPENLEELRDILWTEFQQHVGDSIMSSKIDNLIFDIESYLGYYDEDEYEEGYNHLVDPEDEF